MTGACAELAELKSAFLDGALSAADYDRLSAHLAGCESCRRDVRDLRVVHELVRGNPGTELRAPADLSRRLVSIAGAETSWPPARSGWVSGERRRSVRVRTTVAAVALSAALGAAATTGYLAAPVEPAAVGDPSGEAAVEFSSALRQLPLSSADLGGGVQVQPTQLTSADLTRGTPLPATGEPLSAPAAQSGLRRAIAAAGSVDYVGTRSFAAYGSNQTYTAQMQVVSASGRGSQISVVSQNGTTLASESSRSAGSARMADSEVLSLLARNYDLSGVGGATAAGRPATVLEATHAGVVAGRWWVDDETGLVLWQQRLDDAGQVLVSAGFSSLELVSRPDLVQQPAPGQVLPNTEIALTLSNTDPLDAAGWSCPPSLAGLTLLRLRADRAGDPRAVQLVYSDGLSTLSVYEQRGRLDRAPAGSTWEAAAGAYVRHGPASLASWQSGDTVITGMTDGSPALLTRAVARLPHEPSHQPTTMEQVWAGWGRILAMVRG